jgi:hypothetical protein
LLTVTEESGAYHLVQGCMKWWTICLRSATYCFSVSINSKITSCSMSNLEERRRFDTWYCFSVSLNRSYSCFDTVCAQPLACGRTGDIITTEVGGAVTVGVRVDLVGWRDGERHVLRRQFCHPPRSQRGKNRPPAARRRRSRPPGSYQLPNPDELTENLYEALSAYRLLCHCGRACV